MRGYKPLSLSILADGEVHFRYLALIPQTAKNVGFKERSFIPPAHLGPPDRDAVPKKAPAYVDLNNKGEVTNAGRTPLRSTAEIRAFLFQELHRLKHVDRVVNNYVVILRVAPATSNALVYNILEMSATIGFTSFRIVVSKQ